MRSQQQTKCRFHRRRFPCRPRRGVLQEIEKLITAIGDSIDRHNNNPKPFILTAKASDILEKVARARATPINDHLRGELH